MLIEVVVLKAGKDVLLQQWPESATPTREEWKKMALDVALRSMDYKDFGVDLFLCLKTDYLVGNFDPELCLSLLRQARQTGWGARVFIAASDEVDPKSGRIHDLPHLISWLDCLHRSEFRPTDVLLANFDRWEKDIQSYNVRGLGRAQKQSVARYDRISSLIIPDKWHCLPVDDVGKYTLDDISAHDARNAILVLAGLRNGRSLSTLLGAAERILKKPFRRHVLGVITRDAVPEEVMRLAAKYRIPLLQFRGILELRYFLLSLNRLCQSRSAVVPGTVEAVSTTDRVFQPSRPHRPVLLVTSSFHPEEYSDNCVDAAGDVAEILRFVPPHTECHVRPCIRATDLPDLMRMPELTAWVHLGHGDRLGLTDSDGTRIKLDEWFGRMQDRTVTLPLAVLSVCESADTARRFAQAGIGVAIAFEGRVLPNPCRELAGAVVRVALDSNGDRRAILHEYSRVCGEIEGVNIFKPKAYYAVG